MNLATLFKRFNLEKVRFGPKWANAEFSLKDDDRIAAWELYVEMLTRVATQRLPSESGDEETALESIYSLFPTTREILRQPASAYVTISSGMHRSRSYWWALALGSASMWIGKSDPVSGIPSGMLVAAC